MARITLATHWKFQRLARAVGSKVLARGILETLWEPCWVAGDPYVGTSQDIEALCEWKGPVGALTKALLMEGAKSVGFIEPYAGRLPDGDTTHYQVHDFEQHCPEWVRRRRQQEDAALVGRTCGWCGQDYFAHRVTSQYCCTKCRKAANREGNIPRLDVTLNQRPVSVPDSVTPVETPEPVTPSEAPPETPVVSELAPEPEALEVEGLEIEVEGLEAPPPPIEKPRRGGFQKGPRKPSDKPVIRRPKVSPHPPLSVVLTFPVTGEGGPNWYLIDDQVAVWQSLYPTLDIVSESRQCLAWIQANPTRKKTFRGMAQCLVNWFNRSVDSPRRSGPTMITGSLKTAGNQAAVESWLRRRNALDQ